MIQYCEYSAHNYWSGFGAAGSGHNAVSLSLEDKSM